MALCSLDSLIACLDVEEVGEGRWSAPNLDLAYHRVFGGQLLAQAIAVATASSEGKSVKSIACVFPREGSTEEPFEYTVERVQDGRTFATRTVSASQGEKIFFSALVSLHADEDGLEHQLAPSVFGPVDSGPGAAAETELAMIPWENRVVRAVDLRDPAAGPPEFAFWSRVTDRRLPDDRYVHQGLLAHATDLTVIGTALRPHEGYSQADSGTKLATAVTSHTVWFHRPLRIDEWLLISQHCPVTAAGRGYGQGHVLTEGGDLVASFAQESMIRVM